jgi:hypothetical protein
VAVGGTAWSSLSLQPRYARHPKILHVASVELLLKFAVAIAGTPRARHIVLVCSLYGAPACRTVVVAVAATSHVRHGDHVHGRGSQSWITSDFDLTGWIMR